MDRLYIRENNLVFESTHPSCFLDIFSGPHGHPYAFVQCIDTGINGDLAMPRRYWGRWDHDAPEASMREILSWGGKWPRLRPEEPSA